MLGLYLEEIDEGLSVDLGSYQFTLETVLDFARKYDPQPFHIDAEAARQSPYGRIIASGWHTGAGWMIRYVSTNNEARQKLAASGKILPEVGPSPGFTNMRWFKPVYPGDTVSYRSVVTGTRPLNSRPQWGLVFSDNTGHNQNGELVFSFEGKVLTARK